MYNSYVNITQGEFMKDLIYMEQEEISKFVYLQELYEFIFGKLYFELTEKEKLIIY